MEQGILVYLDLMGNPIKVGQLWSHLRHGRESMSFEYDRNWLNHPKRFSLDPALKLDSGSFHASPDKPLFGAIDDSAPDRWGRLLMRRAERKSAEHQKILLSRRFDRKKNIRIPFLSAMSILQAKDNETHSYLEISDAIRQMSPSPKEDLEALWRRIVFNVLISN